MAILFYEKVTETIGRVTNIHYKPELLPEHLKIQGIYVNDVNQIPKAEFIEGKDAVLYIELGTQRLYIEYVDRPPTIEEELKLLKQENTEVKEQVSSLENTILLMQGVI
ncbi:hypothetical protein [Clostridium cylindrosporum]|uniref:Uncharacterized protein n=1 Tax=Clostridium cylindrosporum DSM 605 TaxID=1121307 RepID=A0A0J8DAH2_CLOCY|nr:hypothetical protein [Clostridium cylindrosporum]KMT23020.1 hypothetical protein CLCY_7c00670 [Clostridium cylindrosporum DSM 605]